MLTGDAVVVTVMTNLGFRLGMAGRTASRWSRSPVGDRHVLAALDDGGLGLGGEQCGHVIFADLATTGDGLLTGVQLLDVRGPLGPPAGRARRRRHDPAPAGPAQRPGRPRRGRGDAELGAQWPPRPSELGAHGRVLLRPSGTEPLVRVMVEAPTLDQAEAIADRLAAQVALRA